MKEKKCANIANSHNIRTLVFEGKEHMAHTVHYTNAYVFDVLDSHNMTSWVFNKIKNTKEATSTSTTTNLSRNVHNSALTRTEGRSFCIQFLC